jgi:hypothetical protein
MPGQEGCSYAGQAACFCSCCNSIKGKHCWEHNTGCHLSCNVAYKPPSRGRRWRMAVWVALCCVLAVAGAMAAARATPPRPVCNVAGVCLQG